MIHSYVVFLLVFISFDIEKHREVVFIVCDLL